MFLFAKLVMRNIYDQPTWIQLIEEIKPSRFPQGLGQAYVHFKIFCSNLSSVLNLLLSPEFMSRFNCMFFSKVDVAFSYERILSRIRHSASVSEWKIAHKLLGWMVCAKRPLKWNEIQGAISIDPTREIVDYDGRKLRIHVKDLCGSLVNVLQGDRVELVHGTAKM